MKKMSLKTTRALLGEYAPEVEIVRWRSKTRFVDANWLVRIENKHHPLAVSGKWDGYEWCGHYRYVKGAIYCALDVAEIRC